LKSGKPIVLIFGGSQGAQKINEAIVEIIKQKENKEYQIMWATGPKQYDIVKEKLEENRISINNVENAKIVPYIYNMEEMINISDLIVARSGAMTITEISNLGKPSILIPLPNVSHNHQLYNAQVLEKIGAAKIILDNELKGENLQKTIMQILQGNTAKTMGKNALKAETKDAEDRIYNEIVQLVRKE
jgi:UDP-N-acetylglucosamine--N-acetylmuramyl-(pentapeptide) pyrophosphoryl-undecaprenol N-acetylglucosamine transferase